MAQQQERQADWKKACGSAWTDSGLVVTTQIGTFVHPRVPNRRLKLLAREAEIKRLSTHSERHTNITAQLRAGEQLDVVPARSGHSSSVVTATAYRTVLRDEMIGGGFEFDDYLTSDSEGEI